MNLLTANEIEVSKEILKLANYKVKSGKILLVLIEQLERVVFTRQIVLTQLNNALKKFEVCQ